MFSLDGFLPEFFFQKIWKSSVFISSYFHSLVEIQYKNYMQSSKLFLPSRIVSYCVFSIVLSCLVLNESGTGASHHLPMEIALQPKQTAGLANLLKIQLNVPLLLFHPYFLFQADNICLLGKKQLENLVKNIETIRKNCMVSIQFPNVAVEEVTVRRSPFLFHSKLCGLQRKHQLYQQQLEMVLTALLL